MLKELLKSGCYKWWASLPLWKWGIHTDHWEVNCKVNIHDLDMEVKNHLKEIKLDPRTDMLGICYMNMLICLQKMSSKTAVDWTRKNRKKRATEINALSSTVWRRGALAKGIWGFWPQKDEGISHGEMDTWIEINALDIFWCHRQNHSYQSLMPINIYLTFYLSNLSCSYFMALGQQETTCWLWFCSLWNNAQRERIGWA